MKKQVTMLEEIEDIIGVFQKKVLAFGPIKYCLAKK